MPDSPVDIPSSAAFKPAPDSGGLKEITATFDEAVETPALGSVLDFGELGTFKLEKCLGRGGMGEVYQARQIGAKGFSQLVAIKRMRPGRHDWEERSFVDEARVLAMLRHENIARVYGFFERDGHAYLVMEYIEGQTLYSLLEQANRKRDRLAEPAACEIAAEVAEALDHAHRATDEIGRPLQLVHRDVSTTNILITATGRAKLVDFGVAYSKLEGRVATGSASTIIKGKVPYLSPEQVKHQPVDARSDLFALGSILVEMLTGKPPFGWTADFSTLKRIALVSPERVTAATAGVPEALRAICQKLLAREPNQRFGSGREVAQALRQHLGQYDGPARVQEEIARINGLPARAPAMPAARALVEIRRLRRLLVVAGVLALAVLAATFWYGRQLSPLNQPSPSMNRSDVAPPNNTCWKALAVAGVTTIAACQAHFPANARGELCADKPYRTALGPLGMTPIPQVFYVDFISFGEGRKCSGKPTLYGPRIPGVPGDHVPLDEGQREPCPFGEGPIVARMSWRDPRTDAFAPRIGPHRNDRPLLHGEAYVHTFKKRGGGEFLKEPGYVEHPRFGVARMMVVFTDLQTLSGNKHPICGVLYWYDGQEGIPILAPEYYGERVAADWGTESYVQLFYP